MAKVVKLYVALLLYFSLTLITERSKHETLRLLDSVLFLMGSGSYSNIILPETI